MAIRERMVRATLTAMGLVTAAQLDQALAEQRKSQERCSQILIHLGFLSKELSTATLLPLLGVTPQRLPQTPPAADALQGVPAAFARQHRLLPLGKEGEKLLVASDDVLNVLSLEWLSQQLRSPVELTVVPEQELTQALERCYPATAEAVAAVRPSVGTGPARPRTGGTGQPGVPWTQLGAAASEEEASIIQLVHQIISEAARRRASDIHLEPMAEQLTLRYRIDGVLHELPGPPKSLQGPVISRVKIMAGMNIAEKRLPQDGRIAFEGNGRKLDLRVSTLPATHGESVVLRLLDKSGAAPELAQLGMSPEDQESFRRLIHAPNGIVLVTGPTGSGKTTTLYAALRHLNTNERKLITVEDPVEYQLGGVNQVQVKPQIGLTFAQGLRAMLRQAPDVIMVGEIRDTETAQVAIQAALTGHLILSTLHTNDAPGAVTRLLDMGIAPYLVASTVQGVLAQRLVRVTCQQCRAPYAPTPSERQLLRASGSGPEVLYRGAGCEQCSQTGYRGRLGIYELLAMKEALRALVVQRVPSGVLKARACELGMRTLRDDGLRKVLEGQTTIAEVLRVV